MEEQKKVVEKMEKKVKEIKLNEYHSKVYLENERKKYKEEVKFILPNGKEV